MKALGANESCSFLPVDAGSRGCRQPRSCQSCLETTGCMVNAMGQCVDTHDEALDESIDFHKAIEGGLVVADAALAQRKRVRAPQSWQFPAGSARYCNASDTTCSACVRNNFWRSKATVPDSRFCLGDDGVCVCVDLCERPWYIREDCSRGGGPSATATALPEGYSSEHDELTEKLWRGIMVLAGVSFVLLVIFLHRKCADEELQRVRRLQARQARRDTRARALGVNALTLTGWESYRRDLIDKEKARQADESGESKTEDEATASEHSSEIHTPLTASGEYVSLDESRPSQGARFAVTSIRGISDARTSRLAAFNEATPSREMLAPLRGRVD